MACGRVAFVAASKLTAAICAHIATSVLLRGTPVVSSSKVVVLAVHSRSLVHFRWLHDHIPLTSRGSCTTCRRATDEPRRLTNASQGGGADGGTSELVKDHARAAVERIVRRACLNLANRPWRLAGVRWGSSLRLVAKKKLGSGWRRL